MNAESERVLLTNVLEKVRWLLVQLNSKRHCGEYKLNTLDDCRPNQCRDLSNGWDGLRYGALHTSLAREF